ncbi:MAG: protein-glutamate O-methyltransferase CheR [Planctomycetota bacterium]
MIKVANGEMPLMQKMARELTGFALAGSKTYLVENRLGPIAERHGCKTYQELYFKIRYGQDKVLLQEVVDAITTHETQFFRDATPFDALQFKVLPEVLDARGKTSAPKRLRIWSAACSTGQEPYSIGMVLHDLLPSPETWDVEILATDIADATLATAQAATYAGIDLERSGRPKMSKYLERAAGGMRVVESVRRMVKFRRLNLIEPFAAMGPFDVVFLRNVLIYFDAATKVDILRRTHAVMQPWGVLFLGSTENMVDVDAGFVSQEHCRATMYRVGRGRPLKV